LLKGAAGRRSDSTTARRLPWLAFAGSGAIVAAGLLTWSVLAGRPAAPEIPVNGNIEQQIPFGPVKIHPVQPPRRDAKSPGLIATKPLPVESTAASVVRSAKPHAAVRQRPLQAQAAGKARSARRHPSPDDEVIVRHYQTPPRQTKMQISSTGVKHISDQ
jgi:hypothetical protein